LKIENFSADADLCNPQARLRSPAVMKIKPIRGRKIVRMNDKRFINHTNHYNHTKITVQTRALKIEN
jgi:hypothetical protein